MPDFRLSVLTVCVITALTIAGCTHTEIQRDLPVSATERTAACFAELADRRPADVAGLTLFLSRMPKGGDIHHHYSGSLYAENYLTMAERRGYRIDPGQLVVVRNGQGLTVAELRNNQALHRAFLQKWSTLDYVPAPPPQLPPDMYFFSTFAAIGSIAPEEQAVGLQMLKQRALRENVQYIETMLSPSFSKKDLQFDQDCRSLVADPAKLNARFTLFADQLERDPEFQRTLKDFTGHLQTIHKGIDEIRFTCRFQCCGYRIGEPSSVFSGLYLAFALQRSSPLVVGANLVGAENNPAALRDYRLHMRMLQFLKARFPQAKLALHAGELTSGLVTPEDLASHIDEAVNLAGANRIGHGVDIAGETRALPLLLQMRDRQIPVEIALSSNEFILGVTGPRHPFDLYRRFRVPLIVATDDSGVSRSSLTQQYVMLATRYQLSYSEIKDIVYNSIRYAFLTDAERNRQLLILEHSFSVFESEISRSFPMNSTNGQISNQPQ